jgi:hypothetical protein
MPARQGAPALQRGYLSPRRTARRDRRASNPRAESKAPRARARSSGLPGEAVGAGLAAGHMEHACGPAARPKGAKGPAVIRAAPEGSGPVRVRPKRRLPDRAEWADGSVHLLTDGRVGIRIETSRTSGDETCGYFKVAPMNRRHRRCTRQRAFRLAQPDRAAMKPAPVL